MRIVLSFLLLFALGAGLSGCSTPSGPDTRYAQVKIYHTNDIHSHLMPDSLGRGGFAYLASVLHVVRQQQEPSALILDAGDMYKKGSLPAQMSGDEVTADLISQMPYYDARAVGNNEIKVGIAKLIDWSRSKETAPLLSANFVDKDGKPVFQTQMIFKRAGLTIGVIGVSPDVTLEDNIQPDPAKDKRAPYKVLEPRATVDPLIAKLRPQVDVLILLSHWNYEKNVAWAKANPAIDLIVSGHSHVLTKDQKKLGGNLVVEAGEFGHQLGVVTVVYDRQAKHVSSLESVFWPIGTDMQVPDPRISEGVAQAYRKWAPTAGQKLAVVSGEMDLIRPEEPYEGSFDDWATDQMCASVDCDLGFANREMFRESVKKGDVTKDSVFLAAPYDDRVATVTLPREKILKMLTDGLADGFKNSGMNEFAFSKAKVVANKDGKDISKIKIVPESAKAQLKISLPYYVTTHCAEFFRKEYCPFEGVEKGGDVRQIFENAFIKAKTLSPPVKGRVRVISNDDEDAAPPEVSSGDDTEPGSGETYD